MTTECPFEPNVLDAVTNDAWTESLRAHVASCDDCAATAEVGPWMTRFSGLDEREHVLPEPAQHLVERLRRGRRRPRDSRAHLFRRRPPQRRDRGVGQPVDEHVDGSVAECPHRLGIEREPIPLHG